MRRKKVKPSREGLIVKDDFGRTIPYSEDGFEVNFTTLISRSVKEGDLVIVEEKKKKGKN
jgi:hypothetical protein